jgi:hypothetical protein
MPPKKNSIPKNTYKLHTPVNKTTKRKKGASRATFAEFRETIAPPKSITVRRESVDIPIAKLLISLNIQLKKTLDDYAFEVKEEIKDERNINFKTDLHYLISPTILQSLVKEATNYIKIAIKSSRQNIVIIDGENLLHNTILNKNKCIKLCLSLLNKNYFVFILRHTNSPLNIHNWSEFKKYKGENKKLLNDCIKEINKGVAGSMLDDFFVVLLSVIAHKSTKYRVPNFLTNLTIKEFKKSFTKMEFFQLGTTSMKNQETQNNFINNLANETINHPNNLILSLDKFKWLEIKSYRNEYSMLNNEAGAAGSAGTAGAAGAAGAAGTSGTAGAAGTAGTAAKEKGKEKEKGKGKGKGKAK